MKLTNASMKSLAAALALAWSAPAVYSQVPPGSAVQFGMIGVAQSQTLRLSIIAWPPEPIYPPVPTYPPEPVCIAQLGFADGSGAAVGPAKTIDLAAGQGDWLDLRGGTLALPFGGRAEVRPVVTLLQSPAGGVSTCLANAEILDKLQQLQPGARAGRYGLAAGSDFPATGGRLGASAAPECRGMAAQSGLHRAVELRGQIGQRGGAGAQDGESEFGACGLPGCGGREPGGAARAAGGTASGGHDGAGGGGTLGVRRHGGSVRPVQRAHVDLG